MNLVRVPLRESSIIAMLVWSSFPLFSPGLAQPTGIPNTISTSPADCHHVVLLIDQSGSFQDKLHSDWRRREQVLDRILTEVLPSLLTAPLPGTREVVYRPGQDVVSLLFFGLFASDPRIDQALVRERFLFREDFSFLDLTCQLTNWYQHPPAELTVLSATFAASLTRIGRRYHEVGESKVFSRTYLVRITDELLNTSGYFSELTTVEQHPPRAFRDRITGFKTLYASLMGVDRSVELLNPDHTAYVSMNDTGFSTEEEEYLNPRSPFPIKVTITQAVPRAAYRFEDLFEVNIPNQLKLRSGMPIGSRAGVRLDAARLSAFPELEPLSFGWRICHEHLTEATEVLLPMDPAFQVDIPIEEIDGGLPTSLDYVAYFIRQDPYLGRIITPLGQTASFRLEEGITSTDQWLAAHFPVRGLDRSSVKVATGLLALVVVALLLWLLVFRPLRPRFQIEPPKAPVRLMVDLNHNPDHPILVGHATRRAPGYPRIRWPGRAWIGKFEYRFKRKTIPQEIVFRGNAHSDFLRVDVGADAQGRVFRTDDQGHMGLLLHPGRIADLTPAGIAARLGAGGLKPDDIVTLTLDGHLCWEQKKLGTGQSLRMLPLQVDVRPYRQRVRVSLLDVAEEIEYGRGAPARLAVIVLRGREDRDFVAEVDFGIALRLRLASPLPGGPQSDRPSPDLSIGAPEVAQATDDSPVSADAESGNDPGADSAEATLPAHRIPTCEVNHGSGKEAMSRNPLRIRFRGFLPKQALHVPVSICFPESSSEETPAYLKEPLHFSLEAYLVHGDEHFDFADPSGEVVSELPPSPVVITPSHEISNPIVSLEATSPAMSAQARNLLPFIQDGLVKLKLDDWDRRAKRSLSGHWSNLTLPRLRFGNSATKGRGLVTYKIRHKEIVVRFDRRQLKLRADPEHLIEISYEGPTPVKGVYSLADVKQSVPVLEATIGPNAGDKSLVLQLGLTRRLAQQSLIEFRGDAMESSVEIDIPVSLTCENPDQDAVSPEILEFVLKIDYAILREPGPQTLSLDLGTSAIAVGYLDSEGKDHVLDLHEALAVTEDENAGKIFMDHEESMFLPATVAALNNDIMKALPLKERQHLYSAAVMFPAGQYFESHHECLLPQIKMVLSSYDTQVYVPVLSRPLAVSAVLADVYRILLKIFVIPEIARRFNIPHDQLRREIQRVVVTLPNAALGQTATLMRDALCSLGDSRGFHFARRHVTFITESEAAAYWFLYRHLTQEHMQQLGSSFRMLVYDCGAGTLDLSLRAVAIEDGKPRSSLLKMLTVTGAGNALDEALAGCLADHLKELAANGPLKTDFEYVFKMHPTKPYEQAFDLAPREQGSDPGPLYTPDQWQQAREWLKQDLLHAKHDLSKECAQTPKNASEIAPQDLAVKFPIRIGKPNAIVGLIPERDLTPDMQQTLAEEYGIEYWHSAAKRDYLRFAVPYDKVDQHLEGSGFYREHVDQPLGAMIREPDDMPDLIVVSGRTSLFPALYERLTDWFHQRDKQPILERFAPMEMKSCVAQGALAYANPLGGGRHQFETGIACGYYGLLVKERQKSWQWVPIASPGSMEDHPADTSERRACGNYPIHPLDKLCYVYSMLDPAPFIDEYNKEMGPHRVNPPSPLRFYSHLLLLLNDIDLEPLRRAARGSSESRVRCSTSFELLDGIMPQVVLHLDVGRDSFPYYGTPSPGSGRRFWPHECRE